MMHSYKQSRKNMVDCQLKTNGINVPQLLNGYYTIPREQFVPSEIKDHSYIDEDIILEGNKLLMEPMVHAKIIQSLAISSDEIILDIGGTGYSAAILSYIAGTVVTIEEDEECATELTSILQQMDVCNVIVNHGNYNEGAAHYAPYDVVFINGAISEVPREIIDQITVGGRLGCIIKKDAMSVGRATIITKNNDSNLSSETLFDANCPYLKTFENVDNFSFS